MAEILAAAVITGILVAIALHLCRLIIREATIYQNNRDKDDG